MAKLHSLWALLLTAATALAQDASMDLTRSATERQNKYENIRLTYRVKETWEPGSVSAGAEGLSAVVKDIERKQGNASPPLPRKAPETTITLESTNTLAVAGERVRFECNHPGWLLPSATVMQSRQIAAINGKTSKYLALVGNDLSNAKPSGMIYKELTYQICRGNEFLVPALIFLRGNVGAISPCPLAEFSSNGRTRAIGNVNCIEYTALLSGIPTTLWCDPTKQYNVVSIESGRPGKVDWQCTIDYRSAQDGWTLDRWTFTRFAKGKLNKTAQVIVESLSINVPFSDRDFDIIFPVDCYVSDEATEVDYRVNATGDLVPVHGDGESIPQNENWFVRHWWSILLVCIALAGFSLLARGRKLMRPRSTT